MRAVHIASLAFICAITASPLVDTGIVPEDTKFAVDDDFIEALKDSKDALSGAKKTIENMVASGKSEKDCRKLVTETRKEVTDNVDICKKTMSALPTGASCKDRGQANVKLTLDAKTKADKHVVYTKTEVTKSEQTEVHFSSVKYSSLTEGKCSSFYSESSYTTAKMKHTVAVSAYNKAVGEASQSVKSWKLAIEAAAKEKKECECKTKSEHETAFAKHSSSKTNAANQKTWMFACHVECVLDKKSSCTCDAAPMCKRPKVAPAVMEASCSKDTAPAPAPAPAPKKDTAPAPAPAPKKDTAPAPAPAPGFVMANAKVRHCPAGKSITSKVDCQKAYDTFNAKGDFKYPAKRGLVAGKWPNVPVDCSIQYADGYVSSYKDQSPHFNTNRAASGSRATSGEFRLFCKA